MKQHSVRRGSYSDLGSWFPTLPKHLSGGVYVFCSNHTNPSQVLHFQRYFKWKQTPIALHDIYKRNAIR